jgi:hypothetical protein
MWIMREVRQRLALPPTRAVFWAGLLCVLAGETWWNMAAATAPPPPAVPDGALLHAADEASRAAPSNLSDTLVAVYGTMAVMTVSGGKLTPVSERRVAKAVEVALIVGARELLFAVVPDAESGHYTRRHLLAAYGWPGDRHDYAFRNATRNGTAWLRLDSPARNVTLVGAVAVAFAPSRALLSAAALPSRFYREVRRHAPAPPQGRPLVAVTPEGRARRLGMLSDGALDLRWGLRFATVPDGCEAFLPANAFVSVSLETKTVREPPQEEEAAAEDVAANASTASAADDAGGAADEVIGGDAADRAARDDAAAAEPDDAAVELDPAADRHAAAAWAKAHTVRPHYYARLFPAWVVSLAHSISITAGEWATHLAVMAFGSAPAVALSEFLMLLGHVVDGELRLDAVARSYL